LAKFLAVFTLILTINTYQAEAARILLRVSHFTPASYFIQKDFLEPWARALERRTRGRVKVVIYDKNSEFGRVTAQTAQVREGVIDIAVGHSGFPRGHYKRTSIIGMPFLVKSAGAGSKALWQLHKEGLLAADFTGFKVIALYVHSGGLFHTSVKPIVKLEDLKGLRIRTPSTSVSAMLKFLGAKPKGMPPANIYENLDRGAIDGLVTGWTLIKATNVNDHLKYHTNGFAYTVPFFAIMNEAKYRSLPLDIQRAIDEISGDALVAKFGGWFEKNEKVGRQDAEARGNTIIPITEEKRNQWRRQLQPMIDSHLAKLEKQGVTNARAIYTRAQQLVKFYERQTQVQTGPVVGPATRADFRPRR
jgi:TRAP-type C4-dicarboxylate transport system substrate-binding protein